MSLEFAIVDVFAEARYAGNQLAVFWGNDKLDDTIMQKIAQEMNYSETAFILGNDVNNEYDVRIFTPKHEVPFAGHPSLGTAHIIREVIAEPNSDEIVLNLKVGKIPITCNRSEDGRIVYWMKQIEPTFGKRVVVSKMAPVLGIGVEEVDDRFPIEEVSTGLPHIIVPLKTLDSLRKIKINKDKYFELINNTWAKNILVFCPEPHYSQNHISVRMFADYLGIPEDPATGSGNGCLAGYFLRHQYWGEKSIHIRSEQGFEIGRPSLLYLEAEEKEGIIGVSVGGNVLTIAKGHFAE